jgi:hypothetical protein
MTDWKSYHVLDTRKRGNYVYRRRKSVDGDYVTTYETPTADYVLKTTGAKVDVASTNKLLKALYNHVWWSCGGSRCEVFNYACWKCQQWMAYDILQDSIKNSKREIKSESELKEE